MNTCGHLIYVPLWHSIIKLNEISAILCVVILFSVCDPLCDAGVVWVVDGVSLYAWTGPYGPSVASLDLKQPLCHYALLVDDLCAPNIHDLFFALSIVAS